QGGPSEHPRPGGGTPAPKAGLVPPRTIARNPPTPAQKAGFHHMLPPKPPYQRLYQAGTDKCGADSYGRKGETDGALAPAVAIHRVQHEGGRQRFVRHTADET